MRKQGFLIAYAASTEETHLLSTSCYATATAAAATDPGGCTCFRQSASVPRKVESGSIYLCPDQGFQTR